MHPSKQAEAEALITRVFLDTFNFELCRSVLIIHGLVEGEPPSIEDMKVMAMDMLIEAANDEREHLTIFGGWFVVRKDPSGLKLAFELSKSGEEI